MQLMIRFSKHPFRNLLTKFPVQLLCLLFVGISEFSVMTLRTMFEYKAYSLLHYSCVFSFFAFWFVTLLLPSGKHFWRTLLPSIAMSLWFVIVELQHRSNQMGAHAISLFFVIYLLAFPFPSIAEDKTRQKGLRIIAGIYLAAALVLLTNGFLLIIDRLPDFLQEYVAWDGTRLSSVHHANITGRIFMMGIAFCLFFLAHNKSKLLNGTLFFVLILLFVAISLTNSRACVLTTCLLFAGNVFFVIHNGSPKHFFLGAAAAILTAAVLFASANGLFQWHSDQLLNKFAAQPAETYVLSHDPHTYHLQQLTSGSDLSEGPAPQKQEELTAMNQQGSWLSDLTTLNSRTLIWSEVFRKIHNSPEILLWGTDNTATRNEILQVDHAHNSWLEVLLRLGIPGLIFSLYFTWQAVWAALCLLWKNSVSLWKKNIAMLVLCLLITGFIEPTMFFTTEPFHAFDFIFFFCLGYLILWKKEAYCKS